MADWRQIQARIRKAKASTNATEQLAELYERTRDAMVAFELANFYDKAGEASDAVKWFTTAAERFRRAQWRTKAEEALTRLGAPIPPRLPEATAAEGAAAPESDPASGATAEHAPSEVSSEDNAQEHFPYAASAAPAEATEPADQNSVTAATGTAAPADAAGEVKKRRRRGRRGGRNRRREGTPGETRQTTQASPERASARSAEVSATPSPARESYSPAAHAQEQEAAPERSYEPIPSVGSVGSWQSGRQRAGEPALASRMAQLESQLRRMLACQPSSLEDADQAPAGPGVLLLSDSDQVTHYYIEACRTLRIAIENLMRGARGSKGGGQLKELMAENLGIAEARVSKYLKDHCAVRWLQLDEGASELAHFAIAVLRPVVNE